MSILAIAHQQGARISVELEKCSGKDASWIRRELVSRAVYFVACYAIVIFAIVYHTSVMAFKAVTLPIALVCLLIPSGRIRTVIDRAFDWLLLRTILILTQDTLVPLSSATAMVILTPVLTVVANREESMRRVVCSLLLAPRTPRSRLFYLGKEIQAIWTRTTRRLRSLAVKEGSFLVVYGGTLALAYRVAIGQWPSLSANRQQWIEDKVQDLAKNWRNQSRVVWERIVERKLTSSWMSSGQQSAP